MKENLWLIGLRKAGIFLLSLIIFILAVYFLIYLSSLPSIGQKKAYLEQEEIKAKTRGMIDSLVLEAGLVKRQTGAEEIYIPLIRILVINKSTESLNDLTFRVYFEVEGERLCLDSLPILKFESGADLELTFSCIKSLGFATVPRGLRPIEATRKVTYKIELILNKINIPLNEGDLQFKLLNPT